MATASGAGVSLRRAHSMREIFDECGGSPIAASARGADVAVE